MTGGTGNGAVGEGRGVDLGHLIGEGLMAGIRIGGGIERIRVRVEGIEMIGVEIKECMPMCCFVYTDPGRLTFLLDWA